MTAKLCKHKCVLRFYYVIPNNCISIRNIQNIFFNNIKKKITIVTVKKKDCIMNAKVIFSCNAI